jgi:hypothetical protein
MVWDRTKASNSNPHNFNVHILVVKNPIYVKIAKTAVLSFLYFHPNSKVTLHCDSQTFGATVESFTKCKRRKSIEVLEDFETQKTWQQSKLKTIYSMTGSHDIFMDADLRWNAPMPSKLHGVTFFVDEFKFSDQSPYRQLEKMLSNELNLKNLHMCNTSFFTFSGLFIRIEDWTKVTDFSERLPNYLEKADLGKFDVARLDRLCEQIALSIWSTSWGEELHFLKEIDRINDGSFVESSYFGATESSYFGATGHSF